MESRCGCRTITIVDSLAKTEFPALVLYPSISPEKEQQIGPYTLVAALDGDCAPGRFPLIVISHGSGGSYLLYRTLAVHLARNGCIAVSPEHPGNNRNNNELAGTERLLTERPRQLRLVIDSMLNGGVFAEHLHSDRLAVIGHSMGGYTALALAGGRAHAFAHERKNSDSRPPESFKDHRVKALVLLAPATVWFQESNALQEVHVPIFMATAEKDDHTPGFHAQIVKNGIPKDTLIEHKIIPNAGHFSFLSPFPASLTNPQFLPSQDPPGFDRPSLHRQLNAEILRFLKRYL